MTASKPIRCLVIQMTRLGDTLQSLMALRAATQLYPNLEVHFLVRESFSAAAKRVPWLKEVITLPTDALLSPVLEGKKTELQALSDVARWIGPMVREPWDLIVNWSYSESSSFLTGLLPARVKLGYSRRKDQSFSTVDGWSHYIQAVVQGGVDQNIHLTDIYTTQLLTALQIHAGDPANDGNTPVTSKSFFTLHPDLGLNDWRGQQAGRKWIGIQLGAGSDAKTWAPQSWAQMAALILRRHPDHCIVLLGGSRDRERASKFFEELAKAGPASLRESVLSLVGATDFDLWTTVLSQCQWLLSGDTAAVHLASVLGTRVLNVSVGPVRYMETGPYGNGHYVIAGEVSPESAYSTWAYASSEWAHRRQMSLEHHFSQLGYSDLLPKIKVFRSKIRGTQDGGGVTYESMIKRPHCIEDWTALVMGHVARAWYCGWVPPLGHELSREAIGPSLIQALRELEESSGVFSQICDEAKKTAVAFHQKSACLKSEKVMHIKDREEIQQMGKKLAELDGLIERLGNAHRPLLGFSQMAKVLMHNLNGSQLSELGQESAEGYRQLQEGIQIVREWITHSLSLAKPMAIRPAQSVAQVETLSQRGFNPGAEP